MVNLVRHLDIYLKDLQCQMKKEKLCLCCSKCTHIMRQPGGTPGCVIRDKLYTDLYREMGL